MKSWTILCNMIVMVSLTTFGQENLRLNVCDALTRKGISFATIKLLNKPEGVYANEDGMFVIKALQSDSLLVSCVGYKPERLIISKADTIFLQPIVVALDDVKVSAKKRKEISIGYYNTKKFTNMFGGRIQVEFATKLVIPQEYVSYRIKKIKIKNRNRNDANPVRLHFYSQGKDGLPDKELLTEDIIINDCIKANDEIDLSRLELVLSEQVIFVGIEWIEAVVDRKIDHFKSIGFGFTNHVSEILTYSRSLKDPKYRWELVELFEVPQNLMVSLIID